MFFSRKKPKSPASLLPLWDVTDEVIVTTQGCYVSGVKLTGIDSEHQPGEVLMELSRILYDAAKTDLEEETLLQFCLVSHNNYDDIFDRCEEMMKEVDDKVLLHQRRRRVAFLKRKNARRFSIYVFASSMKGFSKKEFANPAKAHKKKLNEALRLGKKVLSIAKQAGLPARKLEREEVIRLFHSATSPDAKGGNETSKHRGLRVYRGGEPRPISLRERLFEKSMSWTDDYVRLGSRYAKVLSMKEVPEETRFTMMESFLHLKSDFWASYVIYVPNQKSARRELKYGRRMANANAHKNEHVPDGDKVGILNDMHWLTEELEETKQKLVHVGMQLLLWAESPRELERKTSDTMDALKPSGFSFVEETGRHDREYMRALPGMATTFDRWRVVTSNMAADMMPVFGSCHGDRRPTFVVRNARGELFNFDPVEEQRDNWNGTIFGASGSGKSVFTNMLICTSALSKPTGGRLIVVDFAGAEKSSYLMCAKLFGGKFIPILNDGGVSMNPFPEKSKALTVDGEMSPSVLNYLMVLTDMLACNTGKKKDNQLYRNILQEGIRDTYRKVERWDDAPIYSDLLGTIISYRDRPEKDQGRVEMLRDLLAGMIANPQSAILNKPSTFSADNPFIILDLHGIDAFDDQIREAICYMVCNYVKQLAFDPRFGDVFKYVFLDEVAQLLRNPAMVSLVHELYATARKWLTSIYTATQAYSDYKKSAVAEVINLNTQTQIFLSHARAQGAREQIAADFNLNARERFLFERLRTKKGEYSEALLRTKIHDETRGDELDISQKIRIELSPFDLELATSDPKDRQLQRKFFERNPGASAVEVLEKVAAFKKERMERGAA